MNTKLTYVQYKKRRLRLLHAPDIKSTEYKGKGSASHNYAQCAICGKTLATIKNNMPNTYVYKQRSIYIISYSFLRYNLCRDAKTCYEHYYEKGN